MSDNRLLLTESGNFLVTESGNYIIAVVQYLITTVSGSYTVTGQSATLSKSKSISASYGTYSVTGQTANLVKGRVLTPQYGSYILTGQPATIDYFVGYTIVALNGVYSITGYDANIAWDSNAQKYIELRSFTERRRM